MKTSKIISLSVIGLFLLAIVSTCGYKRIDSGHVGIKVNMYGDNKGVQDITEVTGAVWYNDWTHNIYEFPTFVQHKDYEAFDVQSKDGSVFNVKVGLNYSVVTIKAPNIFREFRKPLEDLEDGYIKNTIYESYRIATNSLSSDSLISNRLVYDTRVRNLLEKQLLPKGFIVQQLTANITPPQSLTDAINAKNKAIQDAQAIQNKVAEAKAQANKDVAKAKGDSASAVIVAAGEAKAMQLKKQEITPIYIEYIKWSNWDGKLPVYGTAPGLFKQVN